MFRRSYRMHIETFYKLYKIIKPSLTKICRYNLSNRIAAEDQRIKIGVILGEKQNEIDDIEDKLEDTFLIASSKKRIRLRKKLDRIKKEVEILEKKINSVVISYLFRMLILNLLLIDLCDQALLFLNADDYSFQLIKSIRVRRISWKKKYGFVFMVLQKLRYVSSIKMVNIG